MKQTIKFFVKIIAANIVAACTMIVMLLHGAGDVSAICAFFCTGILTAAGLGAFDATEKRKEQEKTIRHYVGRNYGQAAVFIGSACVFMGSPADCADVADDLWHYAEPAEVRMLDGEHDLEVL